MLRRHVIASVVAVVTAVVLLSCPIGVAAQASVSHTVQPGENLFRIALYYGTTVEAIQAANSLASVHIYVGQQLVIAGATNTVPPEAPLTPPPPQTEGDEPAPVPLATVGEIEARTYVVQGGETLTAIAARFGMAIWELRHLNGLLATNAVVTGRELILVEAADEEPVPPPEDAPTPPPQTEVTPPQTGTPEPVPTATHTPVPPEATAVPEPTATPEPAATEEAPSTVPETYTVQRGDNLTQISARFGMTVQEISRLNGIANPSQIYVGQVLRLTGTAPAPTGAGKLIVVDLSDQHMWAYEGDQVVYSFVVSTGAAPSYTAAGEFRIQSKIPNAYGSAWDLWMPWWMGIYWAGSTENGIHALPILSNGQVLWAGYLGTPISYGCVVLGTYEAELLYNWATIGTPVSIRY